MEARLLISALFQLLFVLIHLYVWALILAAVFSTLVSFGVLDTRNRLVWTIGDFLYRITEPALAPIRRFLPSFGTVDLSPLVLILLLEFVLQPVLQRLQDAIVYGAWQPLVF